ncbi:MAG: hypothetical protein EP330_22405 [Deltaproteobacteria bacterium]|nr:MAG: hypothetical protein EP330_22405 [Deltaproteobacteria bacterium]
MSLFAAIRARAAASGQEPQPPLTLREVATVQAALGRRLPRAYVRLITEIGDGGFGPGHGMASLFHRARNLDGHGVLTWRAQLEPGWNPELLPLVALADGQALCIGLPSGRIVAFDPREGRDGETWSEACFVTLDLDLEGLLRLWLVGGSLDDELERARSQEAAEAALGANLPLDRPQAVVAWSTAEEGTLGEALAEENPGTLIRLAGATTQVETVRACIEALGLQGWDESRCGSLLALATIVDRWPGARNAWLRALAESEDATAAEGLMLAEAWGWPEARRRPRTRAYEAREQRSTAS